MAAAPGAVSGTASRLTSSPINVLALREDARAEFEALLAALPGGRVCLVVDPRLVVPLRLILTEGAKYLREHGVEATVELTTLSLTTDCESVLYLTRPSLDRTQLVAAQAKAFDRQGVRKNLHVAFVPRRSFVCEQLLRDEGVYGDLTTAEFGLDIFPLDDDVLTMGLDGCFRECTVGGDQSSLYYVTRALLKLQAVYGLVPNVRAKGRLAKAVLDMMLRLQREEDGVIADEISARRGGVVDAEGSGSSGGGGGISTVYVGARPKAGGDKVAAEGGAAAPGGGGAAAAPTAPPPSEIDTMIILDRTVDLVTPLVTPLTMEALLHEVIGIDNAMLKVSAALVADNPEDVVAKPGAPVAAAAKVGAPPSPAQGAKLTLHLNSNDKLYSEIRDLNISVAGPHLTMRARELQGFRDQIKKSRDLEVSDIHKFVKAIPTLQQDLKSLRVLVELATLMQAHTNEPKFNQRWQLERGLLEDDSGQKEAYEAISALVAKRQPLLPTLRVMCLDSVVEGGLRYKQLEAFRREVVATYGFAALLTLDNLERAGLLTARDAGGGGGIGGLSGGLGFSALTGGGASPWATVRKSLALTTDDAKVDAPSDFHFVTSGYAPLSVRLVQAAVTPGGWARAPYAEALRLLPGPTAQVLQLRRGAEPGDGIAGGGTVPDGEGAGAAAARKVVLVVFVGGVTYIEISALRFLAEKLPVDFVVLATSVISGASLIESLAADLPNAAAVAAAAEAATSTMSATAAGAAVAAAAAAAAAAKAAAATSVAAGKKPAGTATGPPAPAAAKKGGTGFFGFGAAKK